MSNANSSSAASGSVLKKGDGIVGLDDILQGGFPSNRIYLVEGIPVRAKQRSRCSSDGRCKKGEIGLYVTLSETKEELEA
jgi:circadian clock protein KaiC